MLACLPDAIEAAERTKRLPVPVLMTPDQVDGLDWFFLFDLTTDRLSHAVHADGWRQIGTSMLYEPNIVAVDRLVDEIKAPGPVWSALNQMTLGRPDRNSLLVNSEIRSNRAELLHQVAGNGDMKAHQELLGESARQAFSKREDLRFPDSEKLLNWLKCEACPEALKCPKRPAMPRLLACS